MHFPYPGGAFNGRPLSPQQIAQELNEIADALSTAHVTSIKQRLRALAKKLDGQGPTFLPFPWIQK